MSLLIFRSSLSQLIVFSDVDWAGCPDDRKSACGFLIYLDNNLLAWKSGSNVLLLGHPLSPNLKSLKMFVLRFVGWLEFLVSLGFNSVVLLISLYLVR